MFGKENASVQSTNREEKTDPHVAKRPTTWRRDCCNRALPQRDRLLSPGAAALRPQLEAAADATQQQQIVATSLLPAHRPLPSPLLRSGTP
jgi:hypothetical protein